MKYSAWFFVVMALECMALLIGAYSLSFLNYHERSHVAVETGFLCLLGGIAGILVTRSKVAMFTGVTVVGVIALGVGGYFLTTLGYHGRAYIMLGAGLLCFLGGIAGTFLTRSQAKAAVK